MIRSLYPPLQVPHIKKKKIMGAESAKTGERIRKKGGHEARETGFSNRFGK